MPYETPELSPESSRNNETLDVADIIKEAKIEEPLFTAEGIKDGIQESLNRIIEARANINNIIGFGSGSHAGTNDGEIVESNEKMIEGEKTMVKIYVDEKFKLLEDKIKKIGDISSTSRPGVINRTDRTIEFLDEARSEALAGRTPNLTALTRQYGIRDDANKLTDLLLELKKL
jgi:hypothetical protein